MNPAQWKFNVFKEAWGDGDLECPVSTWLEGGIRPTPISWQLAWQRRAELVRGGPSVICYLVNVKHWLVKGRMENHRMHPRSNAVGLHAASPWVPAKHSPAWFRTPCCGCVSNKTKEKSTLFQEKTTTKKLNKCYLNTLSPFQELNTEHRSILKSQHATEGLWDHLCRRPVSDVALYTNPSKARHTRVKSNQQLQAPRKQLALLGKKKSVFLLLIKSLWVLLKTDF